MLNAMLAARFPHTGHVWITTNQFVRFHKNKFNEMPRKLDFTKNPRSFEEYPSVP